MEDSVSEYLGLLVLTLWNPQGTAMLLDFWPAQCQLTVYSQTHHICKE